MTLRLYNPKARHWSLYWADSRDGVLAQPMIGEFHNGRGVFYDQELWNDRPVFARNIYFDITPNSYRFQQAFSIDGGKTWAPNFTALLTREEQDADETKIQSADEETAGQHDFDFNFGTWKTHVSILQHPLTNSHIWAQYQGVSVVRKVWNGRASLFELEVGGPAGHIKGVGLRLYDPQSHQWSLNWANSKDGMLEKPMIGEFKNGCGVFYDQESFHGRVIFVRNSFSDITPNSSRFEQAFSDDYGKTWETNWIMTFTRMKEESDNASQDASAHQARNHSTGNR